MKTWYRLRAARKTAELLIYEEIGAWGINSKTLLEQLTALGEAALTVRINSPGGDVFDALAIHNALVRHPGRVAVCIAVAYTHRTLSPKWTWERPVGSRISNLI